LNALVGLSNAASRATSVDGLVGELAKLAVDLQGLSIDQIAAELAITSLEAEHELGADLQAVAASGNEPELASVRGSTKIILSLWHRWSSDAEIRRELSSKTADGRSAEGVFRYLDAHAGADAETAIAGLIRKFIISNHLMIAGQKLATGGRFTYRFMLDDGNLVDGEFAQYTYTTPRIFNLHTFAQDANLIDASTGELTAAGTDFLRAA
jgi:hypothetical protein